MMLSFFGLKKRGARTLLVSSFILASASASARDQTVSYDEALSKNFTYMRVVSHHVKADSATEVMISNFQQEMIEKEIGSVMTPFNQLSFRLSVNVRCGKVDVKTAGMQWDISEGFTAGSGESMTVAVSFPQDASLATQELTLYNAILSALADTTVRQAQGLNYDTFAVKLLDTLAPGIATDFNSRITEMAYTDRIEDIAAHSAAFISQNLILF